MTRTELAARIASIGVVVSRRRAAEARDARLGAAGAWRVGGYAPRVSACPPGARRPRGVGTRERGGRGHGGFGSAPDENEMPTDLPKLAAGWPLESTCASRYVYGPGHAVDAGLRMWAAQ